MTHSPSSPTNPATPAGERLVDILKVDTKLERYVEDFATFSTRERRETVEEIHDIIIACSRPLPAQPADAPAPTDEQCEKWCRVCNYPREIDIATAAKAEVLDKIEGAIYSNGENLTDEEGRCYFVVQVHTIDDLIGTLRFTPNTPGTQEREPE